MKFKLTKEEKSWVLYDVGNSAFVLLVSTIFPIYFNSLSEKAGLTSVDYLAYWGYATSFATLIVMLLGPALGRLSDGKSRRKTFFLISILIGAAGCALLGFTASWLVFLIIFIIAKAGHSMSLMVCISAYLGIAIFAIFMTSQLHFWILAVAVGLFQGGIQALSRSYYAKIIPSEKSGGYFGILDICGKGASFLGTAVISVVSQATDNINAGVGAISVFFVIGFCFSAFIQKSKRLNSR